MSRRPPGPRPAVVTESPCASPAVPTANAAAASVPNLGPSLERIRRIMKCVLSSPSRMSAENHAPTDDEALIRSVRLEDGGLILYDPDNEEAWIQADGPDSIA